VHQNQTVNRRSRDYGTKSFRTRQFDFDAEIPRKRLSRGDSFFAQLDHQRVGSGLNSWELTVFSVYTQQGETWVQVGAIDDPSCSVLLRMPAFCTAEHALAAIEAWVSQPAEDRANVIDLMQVA